jgi:peptidoglycan/LPS O-acetylase OafA/YrhL
MNKSNRLLELDALRGIAALGIVLFHYTSGFNKIYGYSQKVLIDFQCGRYGVHLFFILSGFVIFMSLERTKRGLDFIVGRFARLYPAYWTAVILTFFVVTVAGLPGREVRLSEALFNLTMLHSFFNIRPVDDVYWTLNLELSFYIIMFIIYKYGFLKHIDLIARGWLLLMILNVILEQQFHLVLDTRIQTFLLLKYGNLFIVGMMFYKIHKEGFSYKRYAMIAACLLVYKFNYSGISTLAVILISLVFYFTMKGYLAFLKHKSLLFIGSISYTLYLVHENIGFVTIRTLNKYGINPNTSIFIAIVLSFLLASTITFLIEQPMMRFIKEKYKTKILNQA